MYEVIDLCDRYAGLGGECPVVGHAVGALVGETDEG